MAFAAQRQELLGTERPYPGQLWRQGSLQVIIVAVSPTTVTYDPLDSDGRATESLDAFVSAFRRLKR
jgi:hypothetical protein